MDLIPSWWRVLAWDIHHAGMVVVADGSERAERRLERVLTTDPGMGKLTTC